MNYKYIPIELDEGKKCPFDRILVRYQGVEPFDCFEGGFFYDVPLNICFNWGQLYTEGRFNLTFIDDYTSIKAPYNNACSYKTVVYRISLGKTIYGIVKSKRAAQKMIVELGEILVNDLKEDAVAINFTVDKVWMENIVKPIK